MDKPGKFALLYTSGEVEAVDVFKKDELDQLGMGEFKRDAVRRVHRPSWKEPLDGRILVTGPKNYLLQLRVLQDGSVLKPGDVVEEGTRLLKTRFQELLSRKERERQVSRQGQLENINHDLFMNGPREVAETPPAPKSGRIHREEAELAPLRREMEELTCLTRRPGDVEVCPGVGVFLNGAMQSRIIDDHAKNPNAMYKEIFNALLPRHLAENPAVTRTGEGCTVGVPKKILDAARGFVSQYAVNGEKPIQASKKTANALYYASHKEKLKAKAREQRARNAASATASSSTRAPTTPIPGSATPSTPPPHPAPTPIPTPSPPTSSLSPPPPTSSLSPPPPKLPRTPSFESPFLASTSSSFSSYQVSFLSPVKQPVSSEGMTVFTQDEGSSRSLAELINASLE